MRRRIEAITGPGPSQPSSSSWSREKTHAWSPNSSRAASSSSAAAPLLRVQVAEATLPRAVPVHLAQRVQRDPAVADVHLAVIRGDDERRVRRQRVEQPADELVGERELGEVVLVVQPELVRDGVDARVVRVDEPLVVTDEPAAVLDEDGRRCSSRRTGCPAGAPR